ncbi:ABC transporter, ATP-binding protein [Gleimia coleocanis DSM 15436]|uniref:ABC transporter, ATP-binding protein n=1 Tax=Gleimia coleocanis DSM 15436 TaxID=525245 RepID=C0VY73_9ACTO|nr:metal ABC transporter ATP-binding protein [Gleimia coleocanis]EEH64376.1 ABC transporter, ATP-binding protein [Gleimia coleocanis DSM 15436]
MDQHPLSINNLTAAYHDRIVLHDVTMHLPAGEVMAILGANGAGKSTLIKAALGLVPPLAGETKFFGESLNKARKRVGYMPQSAEVDWDFPTTVADVVTMGTYGKLGWLKRGGATEKALVAKAMETVGITDLADRQISQLSGGQKQRTFMARILAQDPDLFIMDEPFAGVDAASEKAIVNALAELKNAGKTILIVHHDLATVKNFCTWATLLKNGQVVATGPLAEAFTAKNIHHAYGFDQIDLSGENPHGKEVTA